MPWCKKVGVLMRRLEGKVGKSVNVKFANTKKMAKRGRQGAGFWDF
jgi:hypothetical protein